MAEGTERQQVSVERVIDAPAAAIFAVLSDASRHAEIDGSGSLQGAREGSQRLTLGSKFSMDMKVGIPYRISNRVVEFEQDRRIAWCHFGKHRWRYELEPQGDGRTLVRETFDWSTAVIPKVIELIGAPARNEPGMVATLERLAAVVEGKDGDRD
ncbi:MAG TPA: SRPBCC family protein [Acidimicrobiales bacterium]|nr:SRPBCC family protein [Acidimicrobiales bacterium]